MENTNGLGIPRMPGLIFRDTTCAIHCHPMFNPANQFNSFNSSKNLGLLRVMHMISVHVFSPYEDKREDVHA